MTEISPSDEQWLRNIRAEYEEQERRTRWLHLVLALGAGIILALAIGILLAAAGCARTPERLTPWGSLN